MKVYLYQYRDVNNFCTASKHQISVQTALHNPIKTKNKFRQKINLLEKCGIIWWILFIYENLVYTPNPIIIFLLFY